MTAPRLKIAVVVQKYGLVGGGEQFVAEVTGRLAHHPRLDVHVFANDWVAAPRSPIAFHRVSMPTFPRWRKPEGFAAQVEGAIAAQGVDLVHTHERIYDADVYSAHGVPHPYWVRAVRGKRMNLYDNRLAGVESQLLTSRRLRQVLPVSTIAADRIAEAFPQWSGRMQVVHPGVDATRFTAENPQAERLRLRSRCGWSEDARVVIFVGMNFEIKGLGTLMKAMASANAELGSNPYHLVVLGKGDQSPYARLADRLGEGGRVRFLGVVTDGIDAWYRGADLFAMLSSFDTFGLTVLEAMACGLPVIVSDRVGAKDLVRPGENGFISPVGDSGSVASAMTHCADTQRRRAMARNARRVAAEHGWTACANHILQAYSAAAGINLDPLAFASQPVDG